MTALQVIHVLLILGNFLLLIGFIVVTSIPYWSVTCNNCGTSYNLVYIHNGLWQSCVNAFGSYSSSNLNCVRVETNSLYTSNAILDALRAFSLIACILAGISCIVSIFGLPCWSLKTTKKRICLLSAGAIMAIASVFLITAVSWYAVRISYRYYNTRSFQSFQVSPTPVLIFKFGSCIYMGWVFGVLGLVSGSFLMCSTCGDEMDSISDELYDPVEEVTQFVEQPVAYERPPLQGFRDFKGRPPPPGSTLVPADRRPGQYHYYT